jgi:hypothetical protein
MKNNPNKPGGSKQGDRTTRQTLILLSLSGLFMVLTLLLSVLKDPLSTWLPFNLHSVLVSDYSQDPRGVPIARVQFSLIRDLLSDMVGPETVYPDQRYADVIDSLQTPVPTVTAMPGATIFVPTAGSSASPTPILPSEASPGAPTASGTPTPTGTSTPTGTLPASPTPTNTMVFVYPTATRRPPTQPPTRTPPPAATNTSAPPPTQPPTPVPTATARPTQPPTPTPKPTKPSYPPPYP